MCMEDGAEEVTESNHRQETCVRGANVPHFLSFDGSWIDVSFLSTNLQGRYHRYIYISALRPDEGVDDDKRIE